MRARHVHGGVRMQSAERFNAACQELFALLDRHDQRTKVFDDHYSYQDMGTLRCRVQIFTAPGVRPLIVATQKYDATTLREHPEDPQDGQSLSNAAEWLASDIWQRLLPDETEPPIWVRHYTGDLTLEGAEWAFVTFEREGRYQLASPQIVPIDHDDVNALAGQLVDEGREPAS
jgi:hypothetical protein